MARKSKSKKTTTSKRKTYVGVDSKKIIELALEKRRRWLKKGYSEFEAGDKFTYREFQQLTASEKKSKRAELIRYLNADMTEFVYGRRGHRIPMFRANEIERLDKLITKRARKKIVEYNNFPLLREGKKRKISVEQGMPVKHDPKKKTIKTSIKSVKSINQFIKHVEKRHLQYSDPFYMGNVYFRKRLVSLFTNKNGKVNYDPFHQDYLMHLLNNKSGRELEIIFYTDERALITISYEDVSAVEDDFWRWVHVLGSNEKEYRRWCERVYSGE